MQSNKIRVYTNDGVELNRCNNSRARQIVKSNEGTIELKNNEKCLVLNKKHSDILLKDKK